MARQAVSQSFRPIRPELIGVFIDASQYAAKLSRVANRFATTQGAIVEAHEAMALQVAEDMVAILEDQVGYNGRPQRPGHFLERALLDDDNREVSILGFQVGRAAHMDSSRARAYWRPLEEGGGPLEGRKMTGFFLDARYGKITAGRGRPIEGAKDAGMFINLTRPEKGHMMIIGPMPKYAYMAKAGRQFARSRRAVDTYTRLFKTYGYDFPELFKLRFGTVPNNLGQA